MAKVSVAEYARAEVELGDPGIGAKDTVMSAQHMFVRIAPKRCRQRGVFEPQEVFKAREFDREVGHGYDCRYWGVAKMSENGIGINNPHDKLFRETWNDLENVHSFLSHYLPRDVLGLMDLSSLEICKDTFIEKELKDYYSDMLYQVKLSDRCGYVQAYWP